MAWITVGEQSPLTRRWAAGSTLADGRGESWLALCLAADQSLPTEQDWERLGVERRPPITHDWEYAYGVWRVLAWATGARKDVPILRGWHAAAETGRGEPAREDALRHWRHIRRLADSTASHGSSTG